MASRNLILALTRMMRGGLRSLRRTAWSWSGRFGLPVRVVIDMWLPARWGGEPLPFKGWC